MAAKQHIVFRKASSRDDDHFPVTHGKVTLSAAKARLEDAIAANRGDEHGLLVAIDKAFRRTEWDWSMREHNNDTGRGVVVVERGHGERRQSFARPYDAAPARHATGAVRASGTHNDDVDSDVLFAFLGAAAVAAIGFAFYKARQ